VKARTMSIRVVFIALGLLAGATGFPVTLEQSFAWKEQIELLRHALSGLEGRGRIYFEYAIPRLGKWIDVLLVIDHVVFVIEFKRQLALNCRMDNNRRPYERICTARFPDHSCGAVVRCLSLASARRVADAP